jgi:hypothetical protein
MGVWVIPRRLRAGDMLRRQWLGGKAAAEGADVLGTGYELAFLPPRRF